MEKWQVKKFNKCRLIGRFKSLLIFLLLILCCVTINEDVYAYNEFIVTSDVHIGMPSDTCSGNTLGSCINNGNGGSGVIKNATLFQRFINDINLKLNTNRYLLLNGDLTNNGFPGQHDYYINMLKGIDTNGAVYSTSNSTSTAIYNSRIYSSVGNHELRPCLSQDQSNGESICGGNQDQVYKQKRSNFVTRYGEIVSEKSLGGVSVVRMGTDYEEGPSEFSSHSGSKYSNPNGKWCEEATCGYSALHTYLRGEKGYQVINNYINSAYNNGGANGKTVILMTHIPLNKTLDNIDRHVYSQLRTNENERGEPDNRLNTLLKNYPNVIVISGHSHRYFDGTIGADATTKDSNWKPMVLDTGKPNSHSIFLHDGTGIKGVYPGQGMQFLRIKMINAKAFEIYQSKIKDNANNQPIEDIGEPIKWSWWKTTYNANGGIGTNPGTTWGYEKIVANPFTKTGYKFVNWNTKADASGVTRVPGSLASYTADETLYAKWDPYVLNVKYNMNGGRLSSNHGSTIGTSGSNITINDAVSIKVGSYGGSLGTDGLANYNNSNYINITKTGYKAKSSAEWNTKADGSGSSFDQATQYNISSFADLSNGDKTVELYVNWEPINYAISYNLDGGTVTGNPASYNIETDSFTLKNPTKEGYTFLGWTGSNGSTPQTSVTISKGSTGAKTYTANWKIANYSINYSLNGGTVIGNPTSYNINTSSFTLKNPTKEGYTFAGWTGSNGSIPQTSVTISKGTTGNRTYTANYNSNNYTISFNSNGGSSVSSITKAYGSEVSAPISPTKEGYTFAGWYSDSDLTSLYSFTTMPAQNITLYAKWNASNYTISFNSNGGSSVSSITKVYGSEVSPPISPTKEGYTFAGWYSDSDLTSLYSFTTMPAQNITLYAKWTDDEYVISYELDGGFNDISNHTTYKTGQVIELKSPTKEGYTFAGWYKDTDLTQRVERITADMTGNIVLYAKWTAKNYTISFNSNGGSSVSSITKAYGSEVNAPISPTKEGHTFAGWYSDSDLTNLYSFTTMPAQNITLYAKWINNTVVVNFITNGGTSVDEIFVERGSKIENMPTVEKIGYTFKGWYKDSNFSQKYNEDETINDNTTLYAKFEINTYTVTYETNGGSNVSSENVTYNDKLNEPVAPKKEGYTFAGWYKDIILVTEYDFDNIVDHDMTLYAKWKSNNYTISFNSNGGSSVSSITKVYGSEVNAPISPTKEGYTFAGWYSDSDLTRLYSFTTMPAQNITLYAKWTDDEYVISYELDGGFNDVSNHTTYKTGQVIELKSPTKEGYTFAGWYKDTDLTQRVERITEDMMGNLTLYAKWSINKYKVTFVVDGETVKEDVVNHGEVISIPKLEMSGYTFNGWYSDGEMKQLYDTSTNVTTNLTLYGAFVVNSYTITFDSNGGSEVNSITGLYESEIKEPNQPYKENYKFAGWYSDSDLTSLYSFSTMPAKNITLYAKWVSNNEYVITYITNGGINDLSNPTSYKKGEVKAIKSATRRGYEFIGWYTKDAKKVMNTKNLDGDVVLYAKWKEVNSIYVPDTGSNMSVLTIVVGVSLILVGGYVVLTGRTVRKKDK